MIRKMSQRKLPKNVRKNKLMALANRALKKKLL